MLIDLSLPISNDNPFLKEEMSVAKLGHVGTHLDIMNAGPINVERFISKGKLFDVSEVRERQIEPSDFRNDVHEGDFVIFRTNWLKDTYGTGAYFKNHPELSQATIELLIEQKVNLIGLDFPGARRGENHRTVDSYCSEHNIFIVENIANLELITKSTFIIYCFPLSLQGTSGLPVRIIAEL